MTKSNDTEPLTMNVMVTADMIDKDIVLNVVGKELKDFFFLTTQVGNICRIKSVILDKRKQCIRITLVPSRGVVPILDATITSENPISKPDEGGDVVSGTSEGYSDG